MARQVLEINENGLHIVCIKDDDKSNKYRLYKVWWEQGKHRKQIAKYDDFESILWHIHQLMLGGTFSHRRIGY